MLERMRVTYFIILNVKNLIFFVASIGLICFSIAKLIEGQPETAPTSVSIDRWTAEYHGEKWISISGIGSPGLGDQSSRMSFIPLISKNHQPSTPVQVVIVTTRDKGILLSGPVTVAGIVESGNSWDLKALMPENLFAETVVCVNQDAEPETIAVPIFEVILGVVFFSISCIRLQRSAKGIFGIGSPPAALPAPDSP